MKQQTIVQLMDFVPNSWRSMEQLLVGLGARMQDEGWRTVHVFTGEPGERMRQALQHMNSPYLVVNYPIGRDDALRLAEQLRPYEPALIQTHFLSIFNPVLRTLKRRCGARRLVVTDHSSGLVSRKSLPMQVLAKLRGRWASSYVDQVIGVSDFVCRRDVQEVHMPAAQVMRIHNGVDVHHFVPPLLPRAANPPIIGFIGHLIPQKGIGVLLRSATALRDQGRDFRLLIAGEGPHADAYVQEVQKLHLQDRVSFLGQISDTVGFYQQVDILVVPSEWEEAFGFVVAEGAACGACVITSDAGGMPEIVGRAGEGGLVVPRGRADLLTALLVELMGDPERRMRMGQSARSRMQAQFSMSVTVDRYAQQILKLLA